MTTIRIWLRIPLDVAFWHVLSAACSYSIAADNIATLADPVVVTASRTEQRVMDTAASINVVNSRQLHDGQAEANLSEPLQRVPGIFALNRQNYAQDLLISSRGFGANSTFGARGVKIYVDGIPGTVADGQGQISHIDLASADHIEVMRGPFSALYGNSAGGVISVFTENGRPGAHVTPYYSAGSYGQAKYGVKLDGAQSGINSVADIGQLHTDGYRDHSATDRLNANAKLGVKMSEDTSLTLIANNVHLSAQDPLGLTAAQWALNPRSAQNVGAFVTRKTVDQTQGGLVVNQQLGAGNTIMVSPYSGERHITQFLATATNGVIDLRRNFVGMDARWVHTATVGDKPLNWVVGVDSNQNDDHRLAYNNTTGTQTGAAGQNYTMKARNLDIYLQGEWRPTADLALNAGLRPSTTSLSSISNLTSSVSPGSHTYQATTGMASIKYYVQEATHVYLSLGSGFDTPTLNQVFYSPGYVNNNKVPNQGNINLEAARTHQVEIGMKSLLAANAQASVAVFDASTTSELVIASSNGGKTAFTNAPKTSRHGLELSAQVQLPYQFEASIAYTVLSAKVKQSYPTSWAGVNTTVNSGNRIPGVPSQGLFSELVWRKADRSVEIAVEGRTVSSIAVNDTNTAYSRAYNIVNLRAVARQESSDWTLSEFVRLDNVFDRTYVGSIIVNQANAQFYESAPARNWILGVKASYKF